MNNAFSFQTVLVKRENQAAVSTVAIGFVVAIFELGTVAMIYPATTLLSESNDKSNWLHRLLTNYWSLNQQQIVAATFLLIACLYMIRTALVIYYKTRTAKLKELLQVRLSSKLFSIYVSKGLDFHVKNHSTELIRNIDSISPYIQTNVMGPLVLIGDGLVVLFLILYLLVLAFVPTLMIVAISAGTVLCVHYLTKSALSRAGVEAHQAAQQRIEILQDGFEGTSEIQIYKLRSKFVEIFQSVQSIISKADKKLTVITESSAPLFEMCIVVSVAVGISLVVMFNQNGAILPLLAVYVAVAFRLIPTFGRCIAVLQNIDFMQATSEVIRNDLRSDVHALMIAEAATVTPQLTFRSNTKIIAAKDISFMYPEADQMTLRSINFEIRPYTITGITGKSGSGKSTLIAILLGLIEPTYGTVEYGESNIAYNIDQWHSIIGYVPQKIFLMNTSIKKNIAIESENEEIDEERLSKSIEYAGLSSFTKSKTLGVDFPVGERGCNLSGGEMQRVGIARAIYRNPKVLVLDEATSGLDQSTEKSILSTIEKLKESMTVVIVSHSPSIKSICDQVLFLDQEIKQNMKYIKQ